MKMRVTQEKIDAVAIELYNAASEEKRIALREKLCTMCLHYVVNKEQEADWEITSEKINRYSAGTDNGYNKVKYDNVAFVQAFEEAYRGFKPEKGSFSRYFAKCFSFNLQKIGQEKYFNHVSGGIRFDTGMMRSYGEINRVLRELSHDYPEFAGKRLNKLTEEELEKFVSIAYRGIYEEKLERLIKYFKLVSNIYSIDQTYNTDDGEHRLEIEDTQSRILSVDEGALPQLAEIMKQVFYGTTIGHKKYYSCFNMGAAVSVQEILSFIDRQAEYLEWMLWSFVAERNNMNPRDVDSIKDADISEYMHKDKGTISRQRRSYRKDFEEIKKNFHF